MFSNKVVLITGASSGIGAATALIFAKEGANVVITGRNEANLNSVAEKCNEVGKNTLVIKADLSIDSEAVNIIEKTIEKFGKLDILINNAGIFRYSPIMETNFLKIYDDVINSNLRPVVVMTNAAAPYLVKTKGNIVNVSSVMGSMQVSGYSVYCASKAAINHFSRVAANELAEKGVRVNTISPGPVKTSLFEQAGCDISWEYLESLTALNKIAKPKEIGDLIAYIASDKACSVTGSDFSIDCGFSVKR